LDKEISIRMWTGPGYWWLPTFSGTSESKHMDSSPTGVHRLE